MLKYRRNATIKLGTKVLKCKSVYSSCSSTPATKSRINADTRQNYVDNINSAYLLK